MQSEVSVRKTIEALDDEIRGLEALRIKAYKDYHYSIEVNGYRAPNNIASIVSKINYLRAMRRGLQWVVGQVDVL